MDSDVSYKTNYLTEVIARVDFPAPVEAIEQSLPVRLTTAALRHFPIAEPRKIIAQELQFSTSLPDVRSSKRELTEWRYYGRKREKILGIGARALFVKCTVYKSYETLKAEFLDVLWAFFDAFKDVRGSRLGLRYVNRIGIGDGDLFSWSEYLNDHLLSLFEFYERKETLARVFSNLEFNFDDFNLRYQFGMHNPDHPAPIRQKQYVLDLDAYYQGLQDKDEIPGSLDKFHERIQELFELSIKDKLREKMNA